MTGARRRIERARDQLRSILVKVVAAIEDRALVRAEVRSVRIKGLSSIEGKAAAKGWKADETLSACSDLIGGRVVCNNIEDVYRATASSSFGSRPRSLDFDAYQYLNIEKIAVSSVEA
jgi:ppGpp synthetase/RelA/SpoT-type nucleotidyltranferase